MKKLGVTEFFIQIGGHKNNQQIIRRPQILLKIIFNEIAPKMHIFHATYMGVICFFNIVGPEERESEF